MLQRLATLSVLCMLLSADPGLAQFSAQPEPVRSLDAYVGAYDLGAGEVARIMLRGDSLVAEDGLGPKTRLELVSENVFEAAGGGGLRVEFTPGGGRDMRVRVIGAVRTQVGRRISLPRQLLAGYVGSYPLSDALVMAITLEGEQLMAQATGPSGGATASKHPLFPESNVKFFVQDYKSEDVASLEFGTDSEKWPFVVVRQAGFEQKTLRR